MLTGDRVLARRYRIGEEVGRGGMARVYRAVDTVLNRTVAVKVLNSAYASDPAFVERLRREARAAARLNHPNVVSVFDTGSDDSVHFIVMEFIEGRTLADLLAEEGPLDPERAAGIARDVAGALSFAHAEGLVHRDVKPGNVMIRPSGQVKVMDFGIARLATSNTITQTSTVFGTAAYLAPEQAQGLRVDGRADVYALGVVLYEMLAGRVPFVADSAVAVASKHVLEQPEPPSSIRPSVPAPLEAVAMRALAKDPADRYRDAAAMAAALDGAVGGGAAGAATLPIVGPPAAARAPDRTVVLPAVPPPRRSHAAPPGRARWWIPVIVAALGLLLLAAFLPALLASDQPRGNVGPKHDGRNHQSAPATSSPATSAPATSAPATTPPKTTAPTSEPPATTAPPEVSGVNETAAAVAALVANALDAGAIDDHTDKDVQHALEEATKKYDRGDLDKALEEIAHAQDKVTESVDKGEASPDAGAGIIASLDQLAKAMQSSPPPDSFREDGHHGHSNGHSDDEWNRDGRAWTDWPGR